MRLLKKLINVFCMGICVVWTMALATLAIPAFFVNRRRGFAIIRVWAKGMLKFMGVSVRVLHPESIPPYGQGVILSANHQSQFDIMVLATLPVDIVWVSKREVARMPWVGQVLQAMGAYLLRRDGSSHDLEVMKKIEADLRSGTSSIVIFPEGTRTRTGNLLPFKKGAFRTAQNSGVPLLPIGIVGTRAIMPPGELPSHRGHRVVVSIGAPFEVPPGDIQPAMERFRERLLGLINEAQREAQQASLSAAVAKSSAGKGPFPKSD